MPARKHVLDNINFSFVMLGVATLLKEHKFYHLLNEALNIDIERATEKSIQFDERTSAIKFQTGIFIDEDNDRDIIIFSNNQAGVSLVPEAKKFNYIVRLNGDISQEFLKETAEKIRSIKDVLLVSEIPLKKVKDRHRLVYEFEEDLPQ